MEELNLYPLTTWLDSEYKQFLAAISTSLEVLTSAETSMQRPGQKMTTVHTWILSHGHFL